MLYICDRLVNLCIMDSLKFQFRLVKKIKGNDLISMDIDQIPYPTIIYFPISQEVVLNKLAYQTLDIGENDNLDCEKWIEMNPFLQDEIKKSSSLDFINNGKLHLINLNGKHEIINFSFRKINTTSFGKIAFINFNKASEKYSAASISTLYSIIDEITKLKPFLNKTGRTMLEDILRKYFKKDNSQILTLDDLVYYEKELSIIQKAYPLLSHREVILCGLLVNDMDSQDIATITNRSIDAVFVTIHRINRKLNFENKKQLISKLRELISNDVNK